MTFVTPQDICQIILFKNQIRRKRYAAPEKSAAIGLFPYGFLCFPPSWVCKPLTFSNRNILGYNFFGTFAALSTVIVSNFFTLPAQTRRIPVFLSHSQHFDTPTPPYSRQLYGISFFPVLPAVPYPYRLILPDS